MLTAKQHESQGKNSLPPIAQHPPPSLGEDFWKIVLWKFVFLKKIDIFANIENTVTGLGISSSTAERWDKK